MPKKSVPSLNLPKDKFLELAKLVVGSSFLPNSKVVKVIGRAVFPTVRAGSRHNRCTPILDGNEQIGMYDDNVTPMWALLWSHGIGSTSRNANGWLFAHVWDNTKDINSYTHPANLAMVPECFGSLTDKHGPLTPYLRYHAHEQYGWKPESEEPPVEPAGYKEIQWNYFEGIDNPIRYIKEQVERYNNERLRCLKPILQKMGWF